MSHPNTTIDPQVSKEMDEMRKKINSLQSQISQLKASVQPLLPLANEIAKNNNKIDLLQETMFDFVKNLNPVVEQLRKVALLAPIVPKLLFLDDSPPYSPYPAPTSPGRSNNANIISPNTPPSHSSSDD